MNKDYIVLATKAYNYGLDIPDWLLKCPDGEYVIEKVINLGSAFDNMYVLIPDDIETEYGIQELISKFTDAKVVTFDNSVSGPEAVKRLVLQEAIDGGIFIKEANSLFHWNSIPDINCIYIHDPNISQCDISNKIFITSNNGIVTEFANDIISNKFCAGGYYFQSSFMFKHAYEKIKDNYTECHIYNVAEALLGLTTFSTNQVRSYVDLETLKDWKKYMDDCPTIFCNIEGVIIDGNGNAIQENVEFLINKQRRGAILIFLTTDRDRDNTEKLLLGLGFESFTLLAGMPHGRKIMLNGYSNLNFPAKAYNIERNTGNLKNLWT